MKRCSLLLVMSVLALQNCKTAQARSGKVLEANMQDSSLIKIWQPIAWCDAKGSLAMTTIYLMSKDVVETILSHPEGDSVNEEILVATLGAEQRTPGLNQMESRRAKITKGSPGEPFGSANAIIEIQYPTGKSIIDPQKGVTFDGKQFPMSHAKDSSRLLGLLGRYWVFSRLRNNRSCR